MSTTPGQAFYSFKWQGVGMRVRRGVGSTPPTPTPSGVPARVQTGTNGNRNRVRVRSWVRVHRRATPRGRPEPTRGGAEEGGGLPERDPPCSTPPTHPVTYGSDGKPPSPCTHTDLHLGSSSVSRVTVFEFRIPRVAWFKGRR